MRVAVCNITGGSFAEGGLRDAIEPSDELPISHILEYVADFGVVVCHVNSDDKDWLTLKSKAGTDCCLVRASASGLPDSGDPYQAPGGATVLELKVPAREISKDAWRRLFSQLADKKVRHALLAGRAVPSVSLLFVSDVPHLLTALTYLCAYQLCEQWRRQEGPVNDPDLKPVWGLLGLTDLGGGGTIRGDGPPLPEYTSVGSRSWWLDAVRCETTGDFRNRNDWRRRKLEEQLLYEIQLFVPQFDARAVPVKRLVAEFFRDALGAPIDTTLVAKAFLALDSLTKSGSTDVDEARPRKGDGHDAT